MFGLTALRGAIGKLAANITSLAGTVAQINAHLRERAALDGPTDPPALPAPAEVPITASTSPASSTDATDGPDRHPGAPGGQERPAAQRHGGGVRWCGWYTIPTTAAT
ncbi:MAG TPA: hypothetical protein VFW33_08630 [Gemmataceae bacterium]|nr:hypothetical protein [Gemmataceae bacterium]